LKTEPYDYTKELHRDYDDRVIGIRLRNKSRVTFALQVAYRNGAMML
jgi:hypothetical protein